MRLSTQLRLGAAIVATVMLSASDTSPDGFQPKYAGACEASAAAILDGEGTPPVGARHYFAVASDDATELTIFARDRSAPLVTLPLPTVEVKGEHVPATDVEGAARIGDTIYWLTSHSLSKVNDRDPHTKHKDKPERQVLFATSIALRTAGGACPAGTKGPADDPTGPCLRMEARAIQNLRAKIRTALHLDGAEHESEFALMDIEGLAEDGKQLVIGLRGPLTGDNKAYVVFLKNPEAVLKGIEPQFSEPVFLHLKGNGIRSIERVGTGAHKYLIVAGSEWDVGDSLIPADYQPLLYWWDGVGQPEEGPAMTLLPNMVPEAMIAWGDRVQIFGDNGERKDAAGTDIGCSDESGDPAKREFPSIEVAL